MTASTKKKTTVKEAGLKTKGYTCLELEAKPKRNRLVNMAVGTAKRFEMSNCKKD